MRRRKLDRIVYDDYPNATLEQQEIAQEMVFEYYYDRNDMDLDNAILEIREDLASLELLEQYERCAMLHDILKRFVY
tara:strand:+ start:210 stop:440 length:231 start_codon:yes stop_codon:yes gene_type:complete